MGLQVPLEQLPLQQSLPLVQEPPVDRQAQVPLEQLPLQHPLRRSVGFDGHGWDSRPESSNPLTQNARITLRSVNK